MHASFLTWSSLKGPLRILLVAVAASAAAACQADRPVTGTAAMGFTDRHPVSVAPELVVLDLPTERGRLNDAERRAVGNFVYAYRKEGRGSLEILGPSGSYNKGASQHVIGEVRKLARDGGVPPSALSYSAYRSKDPKPPVVLRYERYAAHVKCGQWPSNLGADWRNLPYENFGCATQRNLAAMVEDPRDLAGPRPMTPRDSQRRDEIFDNYRRGQPTGARTGSDDAGTASDVGP